MKRCEGIIEATFSGLEGDHNIYTCSIRLNFLSCATQAFGNLVLTKNSVEDFQQAVCKFFGVTDLVELHGKTCTALWSFGMLNKEIEGLEYQGRRFTLSSWRFSRWPNTKSRLEKEAHHLQNELFQLEIRRNRIEEELGTLESRYTDWDAVPIGFVPPEVP